VVKHAEAKSARLSTARAEDRLEIAVADDGIGFDAAEGLRKKAGFGLFTIRERMKRLGGYCEVETGPGAGTKVTLTMPYK
jgi:signal transduction histidine kinase